MQGNRLKLLSQALCLVLSSNVISKVNVTIQIIQSLKILFGFANVTTNSFIIKK